jgi:MoxR-like ATPase
MEDKELKTDVPPEENTVEENAVKEERDTMDLTEFAQTMERLREEIGKAIVGQQECIDLIITAILADGHVLIEGVPGVAKTLMARLIARLIDAQFSRVQFTPDLMPSDVLGTNVFNMKSGDFDFHHGPIFANIVLVDEINRAPAKTQAALFEVMEERQVTVDGITYPMDELYTIVATQNPVEQEGTYKLPEAQLDRFLMKITMGYPTLDEEIDILQRHHAKAAFTKLDAVKPLLHRDDILRFRALTEQVLVDATLLRYIALIVEQTRTAKTVFLGASPRASVAMLRSAKAYALLQGRDFVTPDDIKTVAPYVLQHRLILNAEAEMEGLTAVKVAQRLIDKVEVPK